MLTPTHLLGGQCAYLLLCVINGEVATVPGATAASAASLIPDLDSRQSYVGRLLPFISRPLQYHFGHRTLTHSLLLWSLACALLSLLPDTGYRLAIASGWASHILLDMLTPSGVCLLWPSRLRCVLPGNVRYRISSMSPAELVVLTSLALASVWLQPLSVQGRGTLGLIQDSLGQLDDARHEFDQRRADAVMQLELKGHDNRTLEDISGRYAVAGPWRETGFLLQTEQGIKTVCTDSQCDWYAVQAALIEQPQQKLTTMTVQARQIKLHELVRALEVNSDKPVYLLGSFSAWGITPQPPLLTVTGQQVTLHYAPASTLGSLDGMTASGITARNVDIVIQVQHPAGQPVQPIPLPVEDEEAPAAELINRWLSLSDRISRAGV